jgi:excisionase family DNA binding protein
MAPQEAQQDGPATCGPDEILLLRVEEAAERLSIARTLMYRLVRTKQVESVCVGRLRRIPVAALEEYVERLRGSSGPHSSNAA